MERRRKKRRTPGGEEPLARLRMRIGPELQVIDISDSGALAEGNVRLLPGARVDVHVTTPDGRVLVRGRVVRAFVCAVRPDGVRYRGGLAFDQTVDTSVTGYSVPASFAAPAQDPGIGYPSGSIAGLPSAGNEQMPAISRVVR